MMRTWKMPVAVVLIFVTACAKSTAPDMPKTADAAKVKQVVKFAREHDFYGAANLGREVMKTGQRIPDHASLFSGFPCEITEEGVIRYQLYYSKGHAGMASLHLSIRRETGVIVEFRDLSAAFVEGSEEETSEQE
jgi:hypothetical protein